MLSIFIALIQIKSNKLIPKGFVKFLVGVSLVELVSLRWESGKQFYLFCFFLILKIRNQTCFYKIFNFLPSFKTF